METFLVFVMALLLSYARADVKFTAPAAGASVTGTTISMRWEETGIAPPISELASYQSFLCAGGNNATSYVPVVTLVSTGDFALGNNASTSFDGDLGAAVTNAYFLKMISTATGGVVINYSDRFSLSSMDGAFPAAVLGGLKTVTGTAGPPTENDIQEPQSSSTQTKALTTGKSSSATSTSATRTGTSSASHASTTSLSTSTAIPKRTSLSVGAGAGIAIGGIILLIAVAAGVYVFISRRRLRLIRGLSRRDPTTNKPQLEDTSAAARMRREKESNIFSDIHELPAPQLKLPTS